MPASLCSSLLAQKQQLEEANLHLVVLGPAYGESLCLRIPPCHWIVVDCFQMEGTYTPVDELLRGETVAGVILTHPHKDHAPGLDRLLESHPGAWVGCARGWVEDWSDIDLMDAEALQRSGACEHSLAAICQAWSAEDRRWNLLRDDFRMVGEAVLKALHPGDSELAAFRRRPRINPNLLSSAMLLEWQQCRILLGADLPERRWRHRLQGQRLEEHTACKLPHHGSKDAVSAVYAEGARDRLWFTTPWNRNLGLPRFEDGEGLHQLLRNCEGIWLTALPYDVPTGESVTRSSLQPQTLAGFGGARSHPLRPSRIPCTGWLLYSFDPSGARVRQARGELACCVVE